MKHKFGDKVVCEGHTATFVGQSRSSSVLVAFDKPYLPGSWGSSKTNAPEYFRGNTVILNRIMAFRLHEGLYWVDEGEMKEALDAL